MVSESSSIGVNSTHASNGLHVRLDFCLHGVLLQGFRSGVKYSGPDEQS